MFVTREWAWKLGGLAFAERLGNESVRQANIVHLFPGFLNLRVLKYENGTTSILPIYEYKRTRTITEIS